MRNVSRCGESKRGPAKVARPRTITVGTTTITTTTTKRSNKKSISDKNEDRRVKKFN